MITDGTNNMVMPVAPMNGGYGYGNAGGMFGGSGDWLGILFLIALCNGGWGGFGFGGGWGGMMGMGMMGMDYLYPWLNNSQNINNGFRDQQLNNQISDARGDINRGFGDVQLGIAGINQNICQTGNGITAAVNNGFSQAEIAANGRQMANMQQAFAAQTATMQGFNGLHGQLAQCCCDNRAATQDVKYTIATEACATRSANAQNTQAILDKLCQLELDGYKQQVDAKNDTIAQLRQEVLYARGQASQDVQTARILAGQAAEIDGVYNRLKNCPVGTVPVYGNQPIFTCPQSANAGCGCGNF